MLRFTVISLFVLSGAFAPDATAQRRAAGDPITAASGASQVSIVARLGSKSYTSQLPGTCEHEPNASMYDVPVALWQVEGQGTEASEIHRLSLTLTRPKNGGADQVSLSLEAGSTSTRIDVNPRARSVGSANVQLQPIGSGGKFELKGKDARGGMVNLTVSCPTFSGLVAEGG